MHIVNEVDNLERFIKINFDRKEDFAVALGVTRQTVNNVIRSSTNGILPDDFKMRLRDKGFDIFQIGKSLNVASEPKPYTEVRRELKNNPITNPVKFYDVDFSAGNGIDFIDDIQAVQPAYTMDVPEFNGCTAFRSFGKSMEPLIDAGAILFATKDESWQDYIEYGQIYGIVCNNKRRFLKYIQKSEKPGHILLRSENKEYEPFDLPLKVVKSIWLVNGWINKRV